MVGPCKTLLMDEISTGLDSSTTYQIVSCIRNMVRMRNVRPISDCAVLVPCGSVLAECMLRCSRTSVQCVKKLQYMELECAPPSLWDVGGQCLMHLCPVQSTVCMSLLQPQRETYNLFDDVLLLADGAPSSQCIATTFPANKRRQHFDGLNCLPPVTLRYRGM